MQRYSFLLLSLFLSFLSPSLPLLAQNQASVVDSSLITYSFPSADSIITRKNIQPDTLPDNIQYYNPSFQNYQVYATQGNIGQASRNIIPPYSPYRGFNAGINAFDIYRFNPDQLKMYNILFPFTDVRYVMGGKKEQVFQITHCQNLGKLFTVSANLRIFNSPGSYQHQKSDITNLVFTAQYHSKNKKYQANLSMCQNILNLQENGGIVRDSVFENNIEPDKKVISVNLKSAQNRMRETSAVLWQEYQFLNDSALIKKPWLRYFPITITHSARYTESTFVYEEPGTTSGFYPFPPMDSSASQDRLNLYQLNNKILLHNPGNGFFDYAVGLSHENIFIKDALYASKYSQISSYFDLILNLPLHLNLRVNAQKFYGGYNDGDAYSEARLSKIFGSKTKPIARISLWNRISDAQPAWTQKHYQSNLISWEENFTRIQTNTLGAEFQFKKLELGYRLHTLKHFIINDTFSSIPVQLNNDINLSQYYAQIRFKIWKIVFDNRVDYQKVDNDKYLHLPEIITRHSVYFDFNLFNGAMILQPGFDIYWQNAYYADAYMPVTRSFYLQNDLKINDQFYADIFVNMKISRARIFFKYQHLNSNFGPYDYYQIPHYPVQDAAIRVGFYWLLRDLPDKDKKFITSEK